MMRRLHRTMAAARHGRHVEQFAVVGRSEPDNPVCARPGRDDRGSVAVLMCFIVLIGAALVGALLYAGANLEAASRADTYASEAARAASIAVGPVPASDGQASLQAAAAASRYLQQAGASGSATVTGPATVRVTVTVTVESVFGTPVSATRTHTAQLQVGVTSGEGVS
jgi:Flp pilus assembly protein TadG